MRQKNFCIKQKGPRKEKKKVVETTFCWHVRIKWKFLKAFQICWRFPCSLQGGRRLGENDAAQPDISHRVFSLLMTPCTPKCPEKDFCINQFWCLTKKFFDVIRFCFYHKIILWFTSNLKSVLYIKVNLIKGLSHGLLLRRWVITD